MTSSRDHRVETSDVDKSCTVQVIEKNIAVSYERRERSRKQGEEEGRERDPRGELGMTSSRDHRVELWYALRYALCHIVPAKSRDMPRVEGNRCNEYSSRLACRRGNRGGEWGGMGNSDKEGPRARLGHHAKAKTHGPWSGHPEPVGLDHEPRLAPNMPGHGQAPRDAVPIP
ncbi:hypothetical protein Sjap_008808 [Stephania japonica]|uniref:Uncharacterized protein n=1 Tax=Stephania japonica TaxID=461633 RepID=A0AAP0JR00_9MAGN